MDDCQGRFQFVGDGRGHLPPVFFGLFGIFQRRVQPGQLVLLPQTAVTGGGVMVCQLPHFQPKGFGLHGELQAAALVKGVVDLLQREDHTLFQHRRQQGCQHGEQQKAAQVHIPQCAKGIPQGARIIDGVDHIFRFGMIVFHRTVSYPPSKSQQGRQAFDVGWPIFRIAGCGFSKHSQQRRIVV